METPQYEAELLEVIRQLPAEQRREVVDFATFLRQRLAQRADRLQTMRETAATRMEGRRRRIGPIDMTAADLVAAGRATRMAAVLPEGQGE